MFRRILSNLSSKYASYASYAVLRRTTWPSLPPLPPLPPLPRIPKLSGYKTPLAFSLFSWLGFETTTVEDEIILDLKRSILLIQQEEYAKAEQMLHLALRLAQQTMNHPAILYAYDLLANLALLRGHYHNAEKLFVEVMQRLISKGVPENDIKNVHISLKLAHIYHIRGDYEKAEIGFDWCFKHFESLKRSTMTPDELELYALGKNWYAHLLVDKKMFNAALEQFQQCHDLMKDSKQNASEEYVLMLNDMATMYEQAEQYQLAIDHLKEAVELGKNLPKMTSLGAIYVNLGRVYLKTQMYDKGRKSCGYGMRLGKDRKNEEVFNEALECIKEWRRLTK